MVVPGGGGGGGVGEGGGEDSLWFGDGRWGGGGEGRGGEGSGRVGRAGVGGGGKDVKHRVPPLFHVLVQTRKIYWTLSCTQCCWG